LLHQQQRGQKQGEWVQCRAQTPATCPLGGAHFATPEAAEAYEEDLNEALYYTHTNTIPLGVKVEEDFQHAYTTKTVLNSKQIAERTQYAEEALKIAIKHRLTTDNLYGTRLDDGTIIWDTDRMRQHENIINSIMDNPNITYNGEAIFSGGLGGAGKTTVLKNHVGVDTSEYVEVNPDDVKEIMAKRGMIPQVAGLTPMECSTLVHEEASYISKVVMARAAQRRANIIVDGVMSNTDSVKNKIRLLHGNGYQRLRCVFVDIAPAVSSQRAIFRYQQGMEEYTQNHVGEGGRYLPAFVNKANTPTNPRFKSGSAENVTGMVGLFTEKPVIYDNEGTSPQRITWEEFTHGTR
jgi:hypothetical protein